MSRIRCGRSARARCARRSGRPRSTGRSRSIPPSPITRAATLQRTLDTYDMGVRIISVTLQEVVVPEPVQDAQRDAIKADKDRQRYQQDAESYKNDVVPRARGEASKQLLDAEAYRQQVLALAQGETSRFDQVLDAIRACARGDARAHVLGHHGGGLQERAQGDRRHQGLGQHAVPAARQTGALRPPAPPSRATRSPCRRRASPRCRSRRPRIRRGHGECADADQDPVFHDRAGGVHPDRAGERVHGERGAARDQIDRRRDRRTANFSPGCISRFRW